MTYSDKLKDPRWQKRRLELLEAAGWQCRECGSKTETLHVHHGYYKRKAEPWDYPDYVMHVLCETCHLYVQRQIETIHECVASFESMELSLLGEVLSALKAFRIDELTDILDTLNYVLCAANSAGERPDFETVDRSFAWLAKAVLYAANKHAEDSGYRKGQSDAAKDTKGGYAAAFS